MTNIVKKIKNVNSLALFTKLVGLAVVFSVVSCDCTKSKKDNLVATFITEVKNGEQIPVKVEAKEGEVLKLSDYTIKIIDLTAKDAEGEKLKTEVIEKIKIAQDGQDLEKLTGDKEFKKGDNKTFNLEVTGAPNNSTVEFKVSIMKGNKAIATADNIQIKWTNKTA